MFLLRLTIRLAPSLKLESHAVACAQSQGIPSEIIARSVEVQLSAFLVPPTVDPANLLPPFPFRRGHLSKFEYLPLQQQTLAEDDIQSVPSSSPLLLLLHV